MYYEARIKQLEDRIEELEKKLATVDQKELHEKILSSDWSYSPSCCACDYELTADRAKELTEKALVEHVEFSKKQTMRLIKESAETGLKKVRVPYQLSLEIQEWLTKLGYTVGLDLYTIYWK